MIARRRVLAALPLLGAAAAVGGGATLLRRMDTGRFDPHDVGAPALGRRVPPFALPDQAPGRGFSDGDLRAAGGPVLVNFFASWCVPCVVETDALRSLARHLPVWGIATKDAPAGAAGFVDRAAGVFTRVGADRSGAVAIDWGVTGVPESFLVDAGGTIRGHWSGALVAGDVLRRLGALA